MVLRDDTLQSVAVRKLEAEVRMSLARALLVMTVLCLFLEVSVGFVIYYSGEMNHQHYSVLYGACIRANPELFGQNQKQVRVACHYYFCGSAQYCSQLLCAYMGSVAICAYVLQSLP